MSYQLIDASVDFRGGVVLKYTVSGEQPRTGSLLFSTTFASADGDHVEQLGFKLVDNRVVAAFSFDHAATTGLMQRNYGANPGRTGNVWTIVFPFDALRTARDGRWHADLDVDGAHGGSVDGTPSTTITDT